MSLKSKKLVLMILLCVLVASSFVFNVADITSYAAEAGYNYDFGFNGPSDVADGYIAITDSTLYSPQTGVGLLAANTAISGGNTDSSALNGDYLETTTEVANISYSTYSPTTARFTFLLDVPNGDYQITANFKGSIFVEASRNDTTKDLRIGAMKANNATDSMTEKIFNVAVVDGQLDLNFDCGVAKLGGYTLDTPRVRYLKITKLPERVRGIKPTIYVIGDSTSNNVDRGWANVASRHTYGLVDISNNGAAARSFLSYYREGLANDVLVKVKPGDIVTIGHGINKKGDTAETDTELFNLLADGIAQRGAIPIFLTSTAGGPKTFYDYSTHVHIKRNNSTGIIAKSIAQDRAIMFIDIDALGDILLNSIPVATRDETIRATYGDSSHFTVQGAHVMAKLILDEIFKSNLFNYTPEEKINMTCIYSALTSENKTTVTISIDNSSKRIITPNIYIAEYDLTGKLVGVKKLNYVSFQNNLTRGDFPISILPGAITSRISDVSSSDYIAIRDNVYEYTMSDSRNKIKTIIWEKGTIEPLSQIFDM